MIPSESRILPFLTALLMGGGLACTGGCSREAAATATGAPARSAYLAFARGHVDVEGGLVPIAAGCSGRLRPELAAEGSAVHAGQTLAVVDDQPARLALAVSTAALAEAQAALRPIEARLAAARREVSRMQPLVPADAVAQADEEKAADLVAGLQADLAVARAGVAIAAARVDVSAYAVNVCTLRAPVDGRIVKRYAVAGELVGPAMPSPLFLLEPQAPLIVRAAIDERFIDQVAPGMAVEVVVNTDRERVIPGQLVRIGDLFDAQPASAEPGERADLHTVEGIVAVKDPSLRIGQRVLVRILRP